MANIYLKHKNSEQNIKMKITEITTKFVEPHFCKKLWEVQKMSEKNFARVLFMCICGVCECLPRKISQVLHLN